MAYTEEQIKKGEANAKKARELLAKSKTGVTGRNLALSKNVVIDNDSRMIFDKPLVDVNTAISEITSSWRKTAEQIINTCLLLQEYKQAGNWRQIEKTLLDKKLIPIVTLKQLLAISNNLTLMDKRYVLQLPSTLDTIYKASQIEEAALKEAFDKKRIQPHLSTKEFKALTANLPRRNVGWDRRKEAEKKASSVTISLTVELPVIGHKKTANEILKHLLNEYSESEFNIKLNDKIKFNY